MFAKDGGGSARLWTLRVLREDTLRSKILEATYLQDNSSYETGSFHNHDCFTKAGIELNNQINKFI